MKHVTLTDHAQLDLSFVHRNGRTVLDRRLFSYPYVLMRTFAEPLDAGAALSLVVQNSGGPIHDRDDLATSLRLGEGTDVRVAYQGATAIHRARAGAMSRERLSITLEAEAHLAYRAEPRILFPEAAHHQLTDIELTDSSSLIFADSFTAHDPEATSRPFRELDNTLTIRRNGEIVLVDRQHLRHPVFDRGFRAFGTMMFLNRRAPECPDIPGLYAARSELPSGLGHAFRLAAPDLRPIRAAMHALR